MRLSKIKLAGFKSFVDPTTVHFPSNLVGVVGPNGCGKSNVIDAIRWVMGETSARHLRGDSMEDVIFNGSSSRKPVGSASIELYFDNSDGSLGGQYASYAEISIRRTVSRDGTSQYFLNNTRCRRKDITGLFMGTGLGPRSYAIIEQGMVSRLVEAKPEEMRSYIEEAAGISKYKERRRETETRIHHTRENLARLSDLRDEVEKQIKHLQRQAQVAEKYRTLKQQERQLEAELLAMRLVEIDGALGTHRAELSTHQTRMEAVLADQRQVEADIERARAVHVEASDAFTRVQAAYYAVQGEIARLEQGLAHAREIRERQHEDLAQARSALETLTTEIERDRATLADLQAGLDGFEPRLASATSASAQASGELQAHEAALNAWQESWHAFNLDVKEQQQARQVEQTRLEHLEAHQGRLDRQLANVEFERQSISVVDLEAQLQAQRDIKARNEALLASETAALDETTRLLAEKREAEQQCGADIERLRGDLESRRGRLEALRVVQNTALGNEERTLADWLEGAGLGDSQRIVHELSAEPRWTRAVETVLGDFLQAIGVDEAAPHVPSLPDTTLVLVERRTQPVAFSPDSLAARLRNAGALQALLAPVRCAESIDEALAVRATLGPGESVITSDGIWFGPGWVRVNRGQRFAGIMDREQEIRELLDAVSDYERQSAGLAAARDDVRREIDRLEQQRQEIQLRLTEANRGASQSASVITGLEQDVARARQRLETLEHDGDTVRGELDSLVTVIGEARERLARAEHTLSALDERGPGLRLEQESLLSAYNAIRERAEQSRAAVASIRIEYESRRTAHSAASSALERVLQQQAQITGRMASLESAIADGEVPVAEQQRSLDTELARQVEVQQALNSHRERLADVEQSVKASEIRRHELEKQVGVERQIVDTRRMEVREFEVRRENVAERFTGTGFVLDEVIAQMPAEAAAEEWDRRLGQTRSSIERLGPINLAAIDEFTEQTERKTYLDAQHADLSAALDTLEGAIRKIDRETRTRFQETFDNINNGLKKLFPRLFAGGHAYLSLEGDDLLSAGVTVMARPPGKRNSHIHLLSGGEKALTAVALIFSIFELNPAPFCLLDEVDAPLDEANVGRFCDIVREMSKTVQFIVITHNKTTMEMTKQLTGVTMNEPGVSRLVAVDIDEAVKLAAN